MLRSTLAHPRRVTDKADAAHQLPANAIARCPLGETVLLPPSASRRDLCRCIRRRHRLEVLVLPIALGERLGVLRAPTCEEPAARSRPLSAAGSDLLRDLDRATLADHDDLDLTRVFELVFDLARNLV